MNIRNKIKRHVASAVAAMAVSAIFLGAAMGPTIAPDSASATSQQGIA